MFPERVQEFRNKFNDTDMQILKYLLAERNNIKNLTIKEIAEDNYISINTVVRFAKKLNYDNFTELKYDLYYNSFTTNEAEPKSLDININNSSIDLIKRTNKIIDENKMISIANEMFLTENCYAFGIGDSEYYATLISKHLLAIGKKIEVLDKMYQLDNVINNMTGKELIIIISASGETAEIKLLVDVCLENGVDVVAITGKDENYLYNRVEKSISFEYDMVVLNNVNISDLSGLQFVINRFIGVYTKLFYTNKI